ncbi:hypothetical protein DPEC_G00301000 [Dallia pectoralis]|uniref:Uncharacterized protein n=1 Tax=Dallia pectoralis TaxID=75939 RepID=A0ACC2FGC9_DALPE|nr:hypothetical protein DPEC_G00301000 [Dallia pectoralis]
MLVTMTMMVRVLPLSALTLPSGRTSRGSGSWREHMWAQLARLTERRRSTTLAEQPIPRIPTTARRSPLPWVHHPASVPLSVAAWTFDLAFGVKSSNVR